MPENMPLINNNLFAEEAQKYFEAHPDVAEQLRRAGAAYRIFGEYLNLTQSRIVIHEVAGSNIEADLGALLRTGS